MSEHYTRNTISADAWCNRCQKETAHRIDGGRKGPCLACLARLATEHRDPPAKQEQLFK